MRLLWSACACVQRARPSSMPGAISTRCASMASVLNSSLIECSGFSSERQSVRLRPERLIRRQSNRASLGTEARSEEHTSELKSLMRISYACVCLKKNNDNKNNRQQRSKQKIEDN